MTRGSVGVRTIGLTGGIGSGKSTVAFELVSAGAVLVDTDAIAHALTGPGGLAVPRLREAFGADVIDGRGALDRAAMRRRAFADPQVRRRLESVLHPMIGEQAELEIAAAGDRVAVVDVPLMNESSRWRAHVGHVLVVDCSEDTQVRRVVQRSGWSEDEVRRVIAQQLSRERRRAMADAVLFNDGLTLDALRAEVRQLWGWWSGPR